MNCSSKKKEPKAQQERLTVLFLRELTFPVLRKALFKLLDWLFKTYFS
jgi:hypothetical protein